MRLAIAVCRGVAKSGGRGYCKLLAFSPPPCWQYRSRADDPPGTRRPFSFHLDEFQPTSDVEDLLNLPNDAIYLKLMMDGTPSRAFSANISAPQFWRQD